MSGYADEWAETSDAAGWNDVPVLVYENGDGSFADEHGNEVFDDGNGGFVYGDGTSVLMADPDDPMQLAASEEIVLYEDGAGGFVDAFGVPVYQDETGRWVDGDGTPLVDRPEERTTPRRDAPVPAPVPRSRIGAARYEQLAGNDGCGRRAIMGFAIATGIVLVALAAYGFVLYRRFDPPGKPGERVGVVIPKGATDSEVAQLLSDRGIISDPGLFGWYVRFSGGNWSAGKYPNLQENSSFAEASKVLDEGPVPIGTLTVTIKEGVELDDALGTLAQNFPRYSKSDFYKALSSGKVTSPYLPDPPPALLDGEEQPPNYNLWEGLLFPSTYDFYENATPAQILQKLADQMTEQLDTLGYKDAETKVGYTPYQVVTVASLIEKETGQPPEERPMIARVIYNRLEQSEILGIDATSLYSHQKAAGSELTTDELNDPTDPYRRNRVGLPPTPISLPSEASLAAAIAPEEGTWMYYVLTEPGKHTFVDTYEEFQQLAAKAEAEGVFG